MLRREREWRRPSTSELAMQSKQLQRTACGCGMDTPLCTSILMIVVVVGVGGQDDRGDVGAEVGQLLVQQSRRDLGGGGQSDKTADKVAY